MAKLHIQHLKPGDEQVLALITDRWYSTDVVLRGEVVDMRLANPVVATEDGKVKGLLTWRVLGDALEILSLDSFEEGRGIASFLIEEAASIGRGKGCKKLLVLTTNDNLSAIALYQKRGFDLAHINHNAIERSRELKPSIPLIAENGIAIQHELEFERPL